MVNHFERHSTGKHLSKLHSDFQLIQLGTEDLLTWIAQKSMEIIEEIWYY